MPKGIIDFFAPLLLLSVNKAREGGRETERAVNGQLNQIETRRTGREREMVPVAAQFV